MIVPLVLTGVVFLAAGVVGGGLSASGVEIKVLTSKVTQVGLALVGVIAILLGLFGNKIATPAAQPGPSMAQAAPTTSTSSCCPASITNSNSSSAPTSSEQLPTTTTHRAAPAHPGQVFWSGTIALDEGADRNPGLFRDLDSAPPKLDEDNGDVGATFVSFYTENRLAPSEQAMIAFWSGKGEPSQQECRDAAIAAGSQEIQLDLGDYACMRSSGGRTVRLQITKVESGDYLQAATTVWDDAPAGP